MGCKGTLISALASYNAIAARHEGQELHSCTPKTTAIKMHEYAWTHLAVQAMAYNTVCVSYCFLIELFYSPGAERSSWCFTL